METMARFDGLPFDVIECILMCENISFVDVCHLSCVCKVFNSIGKSKRLWKEKYKQLWPNLVVLFDAPNVDWRTEFQKRYALKKLIAKKLMDLSAEFYHLENVTNEAFLYFKDISCDHEFGYKMVIDELEYIVDYPTRELNLTRKYYAVRALRYMRHAELEGVWRIYLSQPPSQLSLLEGACLLSQWCQPSVSNCTSSVASQINEIANSVFAKVTELFPKHPVVKHGLCKSEPVLSESLWPPPLCKNIFYCINEVMFQDMKFSSCIIDNYSDDTSFIDRVLTKKVGITITLGIIYATVAEKLGVKCLPVNFPGQFLLKWLEHPQFIEEKDKYTFIDVAENGDFKNYSALNGSVPGYEKLSCYWTETVLPIKVLIKMAWYLVEFGRQLEGTGDDSFSLCNSLELLCLLSPDDVEHKMLLARLFMHLGINITEAISLLQEIAASGPAYLLIDQMMYRSTLQNLYTQRVSRPHAKLKCSLRNQSTEVKFAVGMIMKHKKYQYRCVIFGWDYNCTAGSAWIKRMDVDKLMHKDKQPFYNVLVEDGTIRYAAQENLEIDKENQPIDHVKIGRYFESFHGSYYLPNEQTLAEYPHDAAAREEALRQAQDLSATQD